MKSSRYIVLPSLFAVSWQMVIWLLLFTVMLLSACNSSNKAQQTENEGLVVDVPVFNEDSAFLFCKEQCDFGPRVMNSNAHDECEAWIARKFRQYGCDVSMQKADIKAWDGNVLHSTNIIARINPDAKKHIIICAHWDSRPWADNDPDSSNHRKPVMAANDGASGIAVMIEMARCINASNADNADSVNSKPFLPDYGIDFICFDAEDYGAPEWAGISDAEESWALGAQYFADNLPFQSSRESNGDAVQYVFGILLDMVGGQGARFYYEGLSRYYAQDILSQVWQAAAQAGFSSIFLSQNGGTVTDDHKPLNEAGIPTIDIIPYYPDCEQSGFGPTWHTIDDDMEHIDKNTLKAVGQTLLQFLCTLD